jgi:hypothetical protein
MAAMTSIERLGGAVGAAMVVGGWAWSAAGTRIEDQRGAVALAVVGLMVGAGAVVTGTSSRWRSVAEQRAEVVARLRDALPERAAAPAAPPAPGRERLVRVTDGGWIHRSTCLLARGKPSRAARGRAPGPETCPVCRPDLEAGGRREAEAEVAAVG